ncbi:MAG: TerC family protein [Bacteroidota bacterium]|jgi:predicted tellurium resistance membrane protein TerC
MHLAQDFETLFTVASLVSLATLAVLEIVLGIDNIVFISIIAGKLPPEQQKRARTLGLAVALVMRVLLLFSITWVIGMKDALFHVLSSAPWVVLDLQPGMESSALWSCSGRDLILLAGGIFLMYKSTIEIRNKIEGSHDLEDPSLRKMTMNAAIAQIVVIDVVFSFDSILTAVGLVDNLLVMILAVIIAMVVMLIFAKSVSDFVNANPTIKMLALAFLMMIAMILIVDAFHVHVPKGYVYFSMAFSLAVEMLNLRMHKRKQARIKAKLEQEASK